MKVVAKTEKIIELIETEDGRYMRETFISKSLIKIRWFDLNNISKISGKPKEFSKPFSRKLEGEYIKILYGTYNSPKFKLY